MLSAIVGMMLMAGPPAESRPRWVDATAGRALPGEDRCVDVRSIRKDDKGLIWFRQTACATRVEISSDAADCATMKVYYADKSGALQENLYKKASPFGAMVEWVCARQ